MPENEPSRVLIVDDSQSIRKRISQLLSLKGWEVVTAADGQEALSILERERFDVIALDMVMPGLSGLELLQRIRREDVTTCIVMLSGEGDAERAMECAQAGADDFLEKATFEPLQGLDFRLRRAYDVRMLERERQRMAEEVRQANEHLQQMNLELQRLSQVDQLTGLFNRRMIEQRLTEEVLRAKRYGHPVGVGMLDLDRFKQVNDTYGHQVGDKVLSDFGTLLKETTRVTDVCGRYGGEEFLVVMPETEASGVETCLDRIRQAAAERHLGPAEIVKPVTVSAGGTAALVTERDDAEQVANALVKQADSLLYAAKKGGRNRAVVRAFMSL